MDYKDIYQQKLMSPEKAIKIVPKKGKMSFGLGMSEPPALFAALEKRVQAKDIDELKLYYMHPATPLQETLLKEEYLDRLLLYPFYPTKVERDLVKKGVAKGKKYIHYIPENFHQIPQVMTEDIGLDIFMVTVSKMTSGGYFSTGTNGDYTITAARKAKKLIVEVNEEMPVVFGDTFIHISEIDAIVENTIPLPEEPPYNEPREVDHQIAKYIVEHLSDGATIQIGAGNVPNAVCAKLGNFNDLGIHSELLSPVMADLIIKGNVTNKYKNINVGRSVFTLAAGNRPFFDYINLNPGIEAYPSSYINDPYIIGLNDKVFSLNSFIEVDLFGQVSSDFMLGHQWSTVGGQLDFVEGAQRSKGGVSILAATSTAAHGKVSRIVPTISGPASDTRNSVQYIATEYGIINLRGKSTMERAELLISIAHPDFRDHLRDEAKRMQILF
ncbi:acetyl-CoA hydrolase/transferase family protein [Aureivirga sp. CE67]|uniref:acetyl-CoA hydrolase/transferase family protein n=1 Tax=Aureivirga sp. CE67 TaxID=1788983 RepID=UPI0018C9E1AE|nr:acetyl-CoA hydrolase/transferase family protein [Aureivirga sp. CE67]